MKTAIALVLATCLTAAAARLQPGQLYEQTPTKILQSEAARLDRFPTAFGNWESTGDGVELTPGVQKELGLVKYVSRIYRNPATDQEVAVLIMLGNPGRLVRHPPDVCYANRGSRALAAGQIDLDADGTAQHFRTLTYVNEHSVDKSAPFVVAYGHAPKSRWDVPRFPRYTYGGEPFLYKMQVLVEGGTSIEDRIETARSFLSDYVSAFATMKNQKS